jgi:hypothetical protein
MENHTKENNEIAKVIFSQLGGHKFAYMVGARLLATIDKGLQFHLSKNVNNYKCVTIRVNDEDLYDINFIKWDRNYNSTHNEVKGVQAENLQRVFTEHTGLKTTL